MRKWLVAAAVAAGCIGALGDEAQAQRAACDVNYVIQEGDTLADIAETAFGRRTYTLIYARNFGVIVNLAQLPVGETIVIPCAPNDASQRPDAAALEARMANGGGPVRRTATAPAATGGAETEDEQDLAQDDAAESGDDSVAPEDLVRILTATGNAPYADETLRNGGMATELTRRALRKVMRRDEFEVVFINDRPKHLRELVLRGSFDIAFPWEKPRCDLMERLRLNDPQGAWLCENFEFSEPFYEIVGGVFALESAASRMRDFDSLEQASLCRRSIEPVSDLAALGITEAFADIFRPKTVRDCILMLQTGFVDAIIGDVFEIEAAVFELGLEGEIVEIPQLNILTSIHAVAPRAKADSIAALDQLNQGMLELKLTGEWFRVLAAHIEAN